MDILQGSFSLIFVTISFILGILILLKYFQFKTRDFILVGLSWIGIANAWTPDAISFVMIIFLNTNLSPEASFIIGYSIMPIFLICWLVAFTDLLYEDTQKLILTISIIFSIIFEIFFFYYLFTDTSLIGVFVGPFQIRWSLFMEIYFLILIVILFLTGNLFAYHSIKSKNPEIKLKGKFLFAAFNSYLIGSIIEAMFHLEPITVVITRLILISSAIEFYLGFIMPRKIGHFFLKEK